MADERPIYTRASPATLYRWRKKGLILIDHRHGSSFIKTREVMGFNAEDEVAA
ncbi:hypothetical protein [Pseudoruegeria sp. SHC-113]|uniref:hypothetical protein n=1 Tax=Pseudoruegeria sp. SHC-113 TaxID=2855439 RepID=UPI0021BAA87A|nr:hypothetical protein [Pseudoruegeria sp. SHC-113]MCT8160494.1 hypothetical protein [Pseudoruegeria sp. SHC-113]